MVDYIKFIGQKTREFDKVLLVSAEFTAALNEVLPVMTQQHDRRILILTTYKCDIKCEGIICEMVSENFANQLNQLYAIYEFADNFISLKETSAFSTVFNYVHARILTREEAWQTLLGE